MIHGVSGGSIVNLASMAGVSGAPNMSAYSASKAAVIGLTKAAAKDLAPHGIRVNAVSPGFIGPGRMWETQVARQAEAGSQYFAGDPSGRVADDRAWCRSGATGRRGRSQRLSPSFSQTKPRMSPASISRSRAEAPDDDQSRAVEPGRHRRAGHRGTPLRPISPRPAHSSSRRRWLSSLAHGPLHRRARHGRQRLGDPRRRSAGGRPHDGREPRPPGPPLHPDRARQ